MTKPWYLKKALWKKEKLVEDENNITTRLAATSQASINEYWVQVWFRSAHGKKVDIKLNQVMRVILGTVRMTQVQWLVNTIPSDLPRLIQEKQILKKVKSNPNYISTVLTMFLFKKNPLFSAFL